MAVAGSISVVPYEEMEDAQRNVIYIGHVLDVLKKMADESIDVFLFSPPYYAKRNYTETNGKIVVEPLIWGGDPSCDHEWETIMPARQATEGDLPGINSKINKMKSNLEVNRPAKPTEVCPRCGAWRGDLGNEPSFKFYILHIAQICDEIKRILKPWGSLFVNLGDSYGGSGGAGGDWNFGKKAQEGKWKQPKFDYPHQCLMLVPERFAIEMVDNHDWICHNDNIWAKLNPKPEPDYLRFVASHEYIWFFTKNNDKKTFFHLNKKSMLLQREKPLGTKGEEDVDWHWIPHKRCGGSTNPLTPGTGWKVHEACKGAGCGKCENGWVKCKCHDGERPGWIKWTYWRSYPYYFNQMYEELKHPEVKKGHAIGGNKAPTYGNKTISGNEYSAENLQGRNMRDVFSIDISRYSGSHTAVWPLALAELIIDCACPREICSQCGLPRVRYKKKWSHCTCKAPMLPGIACDPFMGAGTSTLAAIKKKVDIIGCEIKSDYAHESLERIEEFIKSMANKPRKKSKEIKNLAKLDTFFT